MTYLLATIALLALVAAASIYDLRSMRIPDPLNALLAAAGLAANGALQRDLTGPFIGLAAGYGLVAGANLVYRRLRGRDGIGMGDAKMLAGAGAWVGWPYLPFVLLGASLIGIAYAGARGLTGATRIPFGPFIAISLFAVWIASGPLAGDHAANGRHGLALTLAAYPQNALADDRAVADRLVGVEFDAYGEAQAPVSVGLLFEVPSNRLSRKAGAFQLAFASADAELCNGRLVIGHRNEWLVRAARP
jgi:Flp pilus assembly protein protease CpaA